MILCSSRPTVTWMTLNVPWMPWNKLWRLLETIRVHEKMVLLPLMVVKWCVCIRPSSFACMECADSSCTPNQPAAE
jgi:hypothetical protein